jgi:hypothetical protein
MALWWARLDTAQRASFVLLLIFVVIVFSLGLYYGLSHQKATPGAKSLLSEAKISADEALEKFYATNAVASGTHGWTSAKKDDTRAEAGLTTDHPHPPPEEKRPGYFGNSAFGQRLSQPDYEWQETTSFSPSQRPAEEWFGHIRASRK